jgi:hypothetical protein
LLRTDQRLTYEANEDDFEGDENYATEHIAGENGDDTSLIGSDDRVQLTIDVAALEDTGLEGGSSATVALVDQSGAQYTYGVSVPSTFGDKTVVEV